MRAVNIIKKKLLIVKSLLNMEKPFFSLVLINSLNITLSNSQNWRDCYFSNHG